MMNSNKVTTKTKRRMVHSPFPREHMGNLTTELGRPLDGDEDEEVSPLDVELLSGRVDHTSGSRLREDCGGVLQIDDANEIRGVDRRKTEVANDDGEEEVDSMSDSSSYTGSDFSSETPSSSPPSVEGKGDGVGDGGHTADGDDGRLDYRHGQQPHAPLLLRQTSRPTRRRGTPHHTVTLRPSLSAPSGGGVVGAATVPQAETTIPGEDDQTTTSLDPRDTSGQQQVLSSSVVATGSCEGDVGIVTTRGGGGPSDYSTIPPVILLSKLQGGEASTSLASISEGTATASATATVEGEAEAMSAEMEEYYRETLDDAELVGRHVASYLSIGEVLRDMMNARTEDANRGRGTATATAAATLEALSAMMEPSSSSFHGPDGDTNDNLPPPSSDSVDPTTTNRQLTSPFVGESIYVAAEGEAGDGVDRGASMTEEDALMAPATGIMDDLIADDDAMLCTCALIPEKGALVSSEEGDENEDENDDDGLGGGPRQQTKCQSSSEKEDAAHGSPPPDLTPVTDEDVGRRRRRRRRRRQSSSVVMEGGRVSEWEERAHLRQALEASRRDLQRRMASAVLAHPVPLRSYCASAQRMSRSLAEGTWSNLRREVSLPSPDSTTSKEGGEKAVDVDAIRTGDTLCSHCRRRRRVTHGSRAARRSRRRRRLRAAGGVHCRPMSWTEHVVRSLADRIVHHVPISVAFQVTDAVVLTTVDVTVSLYRLTLHGTRSTVFFAFDVTGHAWDFVWSFKPWAAVEVTTEVLASGIQSVAEGVGSTRKLSSAALQHYLSSRGGAGQQQAGTSKGGGGGGGVSRATSTSSITTKGGAHSRSERSGGPASFLLGKMGIRRSESVNNNAISEKLFRKLSRIDSSASRVITYTEKSDEVLSHQAKQRVQRMMHYDVSLKPFVATVVMPDADGARNKAADRQRKRDSKRLRQQQQQQMQQLLGQQDPQQLLRPASMAADAAAASGSFSNCDFPSFSFPPPTGGSLVLDDRRGVSEGLVEAHGDDMSEDLSTSGESALSHSDSTFMCTPKSFPPSPSARSMVMARGTRFSEDVVFLARDQLRVRGALESDNQRTRSVAMALKEGRRLAVFSAEDAGSGIALTCGQHCAMKVGNVLYCSTRSMVPIMRNCYVYFEMSVSTPSGNMLHHASMCSLAVGMSTMEMPHNTLVGAWKSSVGLCTTGQILSAGQWYSPNNDPRYSAFGNNSTVGCLVRLDDESAFETWDGVMVTASVTFNVNGNVVRPPICMPPLSGTESVLGSMSGPFHDGIMDKVGHPFMTSPSSSSFLPLFVPREEELFPTLTLHSPGTKVMCRFCAEDILAKTRESIGAPQGQVVYAVDGSVLFDEDVDMRRYSEEGTSEEGTTKVDISPVDSDISPVDSTAVETEIGS